MQPAVVSRPEEDRPASGRRGTGGGPQRGNQPRRENEPRRRNEGSAGPAALVAVLVLVGLALTAWLAGPPARADGQIAHGFSLPPLMNAGQRISLSDYAGQPLILNFCASWGPDCGAQTKLLALFYRLRPGLVVIGIESRDGRVAARKMLRASQVGYPVADDPAASVGGQYGVPGIPATLFLNARHQIVSTTLGWADWNKLKLGMKAMDAGA
jgi:peroxiredoxin